MTDRERKSQEYTVTLRGIPFYVAEEATRRGLGESVEAYISGVLARGLMNEGVRDLGGLEVVMEKARKAGHYDNTHEIANQPIKYHNLSTRAKHALQEEGIETHGDLQGKTEQELLKIRNVGRETVQEILQYIRKHDLGTEQ